MRKDKAPVRVYSERENPFGPPRDSSYGMDSEGRPILLARDTRMWVSKEELARWSLLRSNEAVEYED